jgi:hypothetical protein
MGVSEEIEKIPFTMKHVRDKSLIIAMLKYEDIYGNGEEGQIYYETELNFPRSSLMVVYSFHRQTLDHFGFDTSNKSVENYRKIFSTYYNSPTDYDADVLNSVYYMRENKCVYYTSPEIKVGDKLKDCALLTAEGKEIKLFDILKQHKYTHATIGAFSNS